VRVCVVLIDNRSSEPNEAWPNRSNSVFMVALNVSRNLACTIVRFIYLAIA
jgi:hypothetical protein